MDTITLSNDKSMPCMVMSTNYMDYPLMKKVVRAGLQCGFRAFDTARDYRNEHIVGKVLSECMAEMGISREEIFITTKIGNSQQKRGDIEKQIDISLKNLKTDYVDLWLMHWPYPGYFVDTYRKMEKVYLAGKAHAIGMANYRIRHFNRLFEAGVEIAPHCVQFECHPLRTANSIVSFCKDKGIAIQAYSPICRMIPAIKDNYLLNEIAIHHGKTVAQIILRWHIQRRTVPVFKTITIQRLKENIEIFDFSLTERECSMIAALDQDYKFHLESASCPGY